MLHHATSKQTVFITLLILRQETGRFCTRRPFKLQSNRDTEMEVSALQVHGSIIYYHNIIEQVTDFKYLGFCISEFKSDVED